MMHSPVTTVAPEISLDSYRITHVEKVITPALAIYMDAVESNIQTTRKLLGGDLSRWRPHVKTAKLACVISRLVANHVRSFKCATTLELLTACQAGAGDVVVAYPTLGARALRVQQIAAQFPHVEVSVLIEGEHDVQLWRDTRIGMFIDVNPGMNRTGIGQEHVEDIIGLAGAIQASGLRFRGLHYYDGQHREADLQERELAAYRGYDHLLRIVSALNRAAISVEEVITSGTPSFPCSLTYPGFQNAGFRHTMSPGTIVYCDVDSLSQLPKDWGYRTAALVVSTVVSNPAEGLVTCDAGHKTVSADAGVPNCALLGHPELEPQRPSEEHLPLRIAPGYTVPERGTTLYLVPRHVCPTVNNFDDALIVTGGRITQVAPVDARGREKPLLPSTV